MLLTFHVELLWTVLCVLLRESSNFSIPPLAVIIRKAFFATLCTRSIQEAPNASGSGHVSRSIPTMDVPLLPRVLYPPVKPLHESGESILVHRIPLPRPEVVL